MVNKSLEKVPMPEQAPEIRCSNFDEVSLGYTPEQAMEEAARCLDCKHKPCVAGCPVNIQIPDFIDRVKDGDFEGAYKCITRDSGFPAICGRVCPQEKQCEQRCVRGLKGQPVAIGRLERFVADWYMANIKVEAKSAPLIDIVGKVAIVGSGPASLACASELARNAYDVTIFEALHELGGVLLYGIPEFRLPKSLVAKEIQTIIDLGVKIEKNVVIGKSIDIEELLDEEGFEAVFIGSGAGLPRFMGIPGENLNGVYSSNEFLTRVNLMKAYDYPNNQTPIKVGKKVAVIGGGNVAMDAARTAKRLGAEEVHVIYRRSLEELPAREEEVHHAKEEGIIFDLLRNPVEIIGKDTYVTGVSCVEMALGEADETGRRRPVVVEGSESTMAMDNVIIAIGQTPNPLLIATTDGLSTNNRGCIAVNEATMESAIPNVYAGGDVVTGAATVILAMGAGKKAAHAIMAKHEVVKSSH